MHRYSTMRSGRARTDSHFHGVYVHARTFVAAEWLCTYTCLHGVRAHRDSCLRGVDMHAHTHLSPQSGCACMNSSLHGVGVYAWTLVSVEYTCMHSHPLRGVVVHAPALVSMKWRWHAQILDFAEWTCTHGLISEEWLCMHRHLSLRSGRVHINSRLRRVVVHAQTLVSVE